MHTLRQLRSKNKAKHIAAAIRETIKAVFVKDLQAQIKNNFCLNCLKLPIACKRINCDNVNMYFWVNKLST